MPDNQRQILRLLRTLLYILAIVTLLSGILGAVFIFGSSSRLPDALFTLQVLGLQAFSDLIVGLVRPVLINSGIFVLVITALISLLSFAGGQLIAAVLKLDERLGEHERQLQQLNAVLALQSERMEGA